MPGSPGPAGNGTPESPKACPDHKQFYGTKHLLVTLKLMIMLARGLLLVLGLGLAAGLLPARTVQAQSQIRHVIQADETLSALAERYGTTIAAIVSLNNLSDGQNIPVGLALLIPAGSDGTGPATSECVATHVIQAGESLRTIAQQYKVSMDALALANGIANVNRISMGRQLCIPHTTLDTVQTPVATAIPISTNLPYANQHTVAAGETLFRIANRFGVSVELLKVINGITDPSILRIGQVLTIPVHAFAPASAPSRIFPSVSAGGEHTCGVLTDSRLTCWGNNGYGQSRPPHGTFATVSAGAYHACAVRTDDRLVCWGNDAFGQATLPDDAFTSVSAGNAHTCGIRADGVLVCWGHNAFGQATPPDGTFTSVSAGRWHTCGVRTDSVPVCWGRNDHGQATPPDDTFASVSVGDLHTCGVRTGGALACWGDDEYGQATPPDGTFASVSTGRWHTCGVRTDNTLVCWGRDEYGQATPPGDIFASVSAGRWHTCGVQMDSVLVCWGRNFREHG